MTFEKLQEEKTVTAQTLLDKLIKLRPQ